MTLLPPRGVFVFVRRFRNHAMLRQLGRAIVCRCGLHARAPILPDEHL